MFHPGMFSPPVWYEVLWSACLCMCVSFSVCLFVRLRVSKPHVQILLNIPYMIDVAVARSSSDGYAIHYVLPVLWMTSCFHMMQGIGHNQRWHVGFAQYATWRISHTSDVLFGGDRQVAAPGEVCLSDCILFVQWILFDWPPFFLSVTPLGTWGFWQSEFRVRWTVWTRVVASVGLKILPFSNSLLYEWRKYYSLTRTVENSTQLRKLYHEADPHADLPSNCTSCRWLSICFFPRSRPSFVWQWTSAGRAVGGRLTAVDGWVVSLASCHAS